MVWTLEGKTALVTGGTSGMGLATAEALAARGAHVLIVGRDPERGSSALERIASTAGAPEPHFLLADLSSMRQVRRVAAEAGAVTDRLHVLVNNAGAYYWERRETEDGLEMTFALNHLGGFLLTALLLDTLIASAPARVINISSGMHRRGRLVWDDLQRTRNYSGQDAYAQSKLANVLFTVESARRLHDTGVTVNAVGPGLVASQFGKDGTNVSARIYRLMTRIFGKTPEEGAETAVYLASSPEVGEVTGAYWEKKSMKAPSPRATDPGDARRLWRVSEDLAGLAPD